LPKLRIVLALWSFLAWVPSSSGGMFDPPVGIQDEGGTETKPVFRLDCVGAGISCSQSGITGTITVSGGSGNSFETISVPAGTNPVADSSTDTLTITETDTPLIITGTAGTDTIDITTIDCAANEIMKRNAGDTAWACAADSGGGSNPGGSGSELQFRSDATTFGAVTSSSVSGAEVTFAGDVTIGGFAGTQLNLTPTGGDAWGLHAESGPSGGTSWWGNATDSGRRFWQADGAGNFYLPQNTGCTFLQTSSGEGRVSCFSLDRTAGMFCGGTMSTAMPCESVRPRIPQSCTIQRVDLSCLTAPTGQALIVDVNECTVPGTCTSIWNATQANRVQCAAAASTGSQTSFDDTVLASGNYLSIDIDQVGSTVAGSNTTVTVTCRP